MYWYDFPHPFFVCIHWNLLSYNSPLAFRLPFYFICIYKIVSIIYKVCLHTQLLRLWGNTHIWSQLVFFFVTFIILDSKTLFFNIYSFPIWFGTLKTNISFIVTFVCYKICLCLCLYVFISYTWTYLIICMYVKDVYVYKTSRPVILLVLCYDKVFLTRVDHRSRIKNLCKRLFPLVTRNLFTNHGPDLIPFIFYLDLSPLYRSRRNISQG